MNASSLKLQKGIDEISQQQANVILVNLLFAFSGLVDQVPGGLTSMHVNMAFGKVLGIVMEVISGE